jgi:hypothetical protein
MNGDEKYIFPLHLAKVGWKDRLDPDAFLLS